MKDSVRILLALFAAAVSLYAQPFWRTAGHDILDPGGKPVLLKGVGLGGWLVPEGYMLHTPGFGSPSSIRAQFEALLGTEATAAFFELYRKNYVNENDIRKIAELGYNSVRLPFHYELFYNRQNAGFDESGFALLDTFMIWCKKYGLPVILDMHCAPGGQSKDNIADGDGELARLWTDPSNQDLTVAIWVEIARRYAGDSGIIGYDLLNEPVLPPGYTNRVLRDFYIRLIRAVREVDADHIVFIEGNTYATDFNLLTPPMDDNMVYAFHKYWSPTTQASIQYLLDIREAYDVPLWLGESGENSNTWFREAIELMEKNNIGWNWWTHKKIATNTSPYTAPLSPEYQVILDYLDGTGSKPSYEYARGALFGMAADLALEKCDYNPDVMAAQLGEEFTTRPVPYTHHQVPGTVRAVDFDLGANGIAYKDDDYKRERWDIWQPWNTGGQYRNDGVDIERSSGLEGMPFNVGWIGDGEWLIYTLDIKTAGTYDVVMYIAAAQEGGGLTLYLDDKPVTAELTIPGTGGWQNWRELPAAGVTLPAGQHRLKIRMATGGFNLGGLRFELRKAGNLDMLDEDAFYGQNYPNPFNGETSIPVILNQPAQVKLNIFDLSGKNVRLLIEDELADGSYIFSWNGTDDAGRRVASGKYFYTLKINEKSGVKQMVLLK